MKIIADLHIHSHFSRATSKNLTPEYLEYWAKLKGVNIIGTGDATHPGWLDELMQKLEPAENGLFKLKEEYKIPESKTLEKTNKNFENSFVRFLLSTEISNIYKKNGKVRKIHNVILFPDFKSVISLQNELRKIGANIDSDGRPIIGIDAKDLLKMVLDINEFNIFFPAHIWTPWFSMLGDKSGFDSPHECFEELENYIFAIETGLSTDPPMNWLCSFLDDKILLSNSDAHSHEKIGRNANILEIKPDYFEFYKALKNRDTNRIIGTIDLFPQEGKYHFDGHRKCNVKFSPDLTVKNNYKCPVCNKKLTIGVMHRVALLSDRDDPLLRKNRGIFYHIIPLKEIISEILNIGVNSKKVNFLFHNLLLDNGSELEILLFKKIEELKTDNLPILKKAILRMRERKIYINEGYDGEYGVIRVFAPDELKSIQSTTSSKLFSFNYENSFIKSEYKLINFNIKEFKRKVKTKDSIKEQINNEVYINKQPDLFSKSQNTIKKIDLIDYRLTDIQKKIVLYNNDSLIIAGPGTGKTFTLTSKLKYLLKNGLNSENILTITFTNFAANEIIERIKNDPDIRNSTQNTLINNISTFHSLGFYIWKKIKNLDYIILSESQINTIIEYIINSENLKSTYKLKNIKSIRNKIKTLKQKMLTPDKLPDSEKIKTLYKLYEKFKEDNLFLDFEDLILKPAIFLENNPIPEFLKTIKWILVDEFQDINFLQLWFVKLLKTKTSSKIFAIGDPDQAIYGFRGASPVFIKKFIDYFPEAKIFKLDKSFRVPDEILKAGYGVLSEKKEIIGQKSGSKISIINFNTEAQEAEFIARSIENLTGGTGFFSYDSNVVKNIESNLAFNEIAILLRIKEIYLSIKKALEDHQIPYIFISNTPFYRDPYFEIINESLKITYIVKNKKLQSILKINLKNRLKNISNFDFLKLDQYLLTNINPESLINYLYENLLKEFIKENEFNNYIKIFKSFKNLKDFVDFIYNSESLDLIKKGLNNVWIMTTHQSKGLEFKHVFIPGFESRLYPLSMFGNFDLKEEKRLFFVALTRTSNSVILTYSNKRKIKGKIYKQQLSDFFKYFSQDLINFVNTDYKPKREKTLF